MTEFLSYVETLPLLVLAGLAVVVSHLVNPTGIIQSRSIRCGGAVFCLYVGVGIYEVGYLEFSDVFVLVFRGWLFGCVVYGCLTLVLTVLAGMEERARAASAERESRRYLAKQKKEEEERRKKQAREAEEANERWQREAPLRAQREREEAERRNVAQAEQTRRENTRAESELLYAQYAPEISKRFSRSDLERFFTTYMSDTKPVVEVERRSKELQRIIEQHKQAIQPDKKPRTIQELSEWYLTEKARIDSLPLDENMKEDYRIQLNVRYSELTQQLLQKMQP